MQTCNDVSEAVDRGAASVASMLAGTDFFGSVSARARACIAELAEFGMSPAAHALFLQGEPGDSFYIIDSGLVEISVVSPRKRRLVLNYMRAGDIFGEIALLDGGPRTASAVTAEPTGYYRISRSDILKLIAGEPAIARDLIQVLCRRLRWVSSERNDQALLTVPQRTAKRLLFLAERVGARDDRLTISQTELAENVGATREAVNRALAGWRARGLVEVRRGSIHLADIDALRRIAAQVG